MLSLFFSDAFLGAAAVGFCALAGVALTLTSAKPAPKNRLVKHGAGSMAPFSIRKDSR